MNGAVRVRLGDWASLSGLAMPIRLAVFVQEQHVPLCLEWDEWDARATHALAGLPDGRAIGTARLLPNGQIGRMAVLSEMRGQGIGGLLLTALLKDAADQGQHAVWLNAQLHALPFYRRFGFSETGPVFDDAGIPHRRMQRAIG